MNCIGRRESLVFISELRLLAINRRIIKDWTGSANSHDTQLPLDQELTETQ